MSASRINTEQTAIIADDHEIVRDGLSGLLHKRLGLTVVAQAEDGLQAVAKTKRLRPDLLLVDIAMPLMSGLEVVHEVRRWSPDTRIVLLTALAAQTEVVQLAKQQVDGLFLKEAPAELLIDALPRILEGERIICDQAELPESARVLERLTAREVQVLRLIVRGASNKGIAKMLFISEKTVDNHRSRIMRKLNLHSFAELMLLALNLGLLDDIRYQNIRTPC